MSKTYGRICLTGNHMWQQLKTTQIDQTPVNPQSVISQTPIRHKSAVIQETIPHQAAVRHQSVNNNSAIELVPLELQRVFYELQHAEELAGAAEVGTERLTRSFGWGRREVMEQQDVQEFARMLCDALQSFMSASQEIPGQQKTGAC